MRLLLVVVHLFICLSVSAQNKHITFSNENFAFEVKQIDEFIERFNDSEKTLIKEYIKNNYGSENLTRIDLLKSLFNQSDKTWNLRDINNFINQVNNRAHTIEFDDKDWYAKLNCTVDFLGEETSMTMIMNIEKNPENGANKWVIKSVDAPFLAIPESTDKSKSINPASHGTNFVALDRALEDTPNIKNYVSSSFNPDKLTLFTSLLSYKKITIKKVGHIAYHFLQIDGWAFKVENFERTSKNSGWLISELVRMDNYQKDTYKKKILNLK